MPPKCHPYIHHTIVLPAALPVDQPVTISTLLHPNVILSLPSPLPFATPPPVDPAFQVSETEDKGFGMFATRDIREGTLILAENPVFIVPEMAPSVSKDVAFELYEGVGKALPVERYSAMATLANCHSKEECPSIVEGITLTNALNLPMHIPAPSSKSSADGPASSFEGGGTYGGVHLTINRGNHSCGANAVYKWSLSSLCTSLYAVRDISKGEEITISYADPLQSRVQRSKKLDNYRFTCNCTYCTFSDPLDQEKSDSSREYLKTYLSTRPSYKKWAADLCLPDTFVIDSHLAVIPIIIQEGLEGMLPLFFEEILWCYVELGQEAQVRVWAEKMIRMAYIGDTVLTEVQRLLEDPSQFPKWGSRVALREAQGKGNCIPESMKRKYFRLLLLGVVADQFSPANRQKKQEFDVEDLFMGTMFNHALVDAA